MDIEVKEIEGYVPFGQKIVVKQIERENKTKSGIFLTEPVDGDSKLLYGVVVKVGDTNYRFNIGDCVQYLIYRVEKIKWNDIDYQIVNEENVVAIVDPTKI